jgi:MFS family permease
VRVQRAAWLGDLRGRAAWVVLGGLICQMGLGFGYVFGPLAPFILEDLDWTRSMYSAARAPQLFVLALASPLVGVVAVRFGARPILVAATAIIGIGFLLFSQMSELWHLYTVVMVVGLALTGVGDITVGQLVTRWVAKGRGLALGIVYTGSNLGGFLLVPLAVQIAQESSWRSALFAMGLGALLIMLPVALFVVREAPPPSPEATASTVDAPHAMPSLNLQQALRTRSFWILAFCLFTFFFYFLGMLEHLVLFLTDEGMSRVDAGGHFARAVGLGMVSKIALGLVADHIPQRNAILIDYGLLALSSLLLLWLPAPHLVWVFVLTYGFATAARDVVYPLIVSDCFGPRYMAEIYGGLMLALIPGGTLGPIFAASVHDRFGSYDAAFATFIGLNVCAFLLLMLLRPESSRAAVARAPWSSV